MPITVIATRGALTPEGRARVVPELAAALLSSTGAEGNAFVTSIVGGTVQDAEPADVYAADGANRPLVLVEVKVPAGVFSEADQRAAFVERAAAVVAGCAEPGRPATDTWVNVVSADEGGWGIGPTSFTTERLLAAVEAGAPLAG